MNRFLPPYLDLGFDQYSITRSLDPEEWCMRKLCSVEHLARYGRPLYAVLCSHVEAHSRFVSDGVHICQYQEELTMYFNWHLLSSPLV